MRIMKILERARGYIIGRGIMRWKYFRVLRCFEGELYQGFSIFYYPFVQYFLDNVLYVTWYFTLLFGMRVLSKYLNSTNIGI